MILRHEKNLVNLGRRKEALFIHLSYSYNIHTGKSMGGVKMKKILFVSSEAIPYMKTGGLADVVGSLPKYIDKEKYEVRVFLPKYLCMEHKFKEHLHYVCHFYVNLSWRKQYVGIFEGEFQGIKFYFVDNEFYFAGPTPYNHIHEDVEKFAFFSKAVLQALPFLDYCPDIIHCHDWQTGLLPVYLKTLYGDDSYYAGIKTIFSIHNMKFQGRWDLKTVMDITGLPEQIFNDQELEAYGEANYLKGGCVYADWITTVSPTYAYEITTEEGGEGLHGLMNARKGVLSGIVNGLDYEEYNPEKDVYIEKNFNRKTVYKEKVKNKKALQKEVGLPVKEDAFLIGMVSRQTNQKGFDLVAYMMKELLSMKNIQMVVLGTGEEQYQNMLLYFADAYPDKLSVCIGYSEERAHRIYASSDAFLMPSLFEPCGLSQMMAMRYGTLPIVRETGGLKDTVIPYNEYEDTGNGFSFANYNAHEMLAAILYALQVYEENRPAWKRLMKRAMEMDYSWNASAREYEKLYERLLES